MYSPVVLGFCGALQENASRQLIDHVCVCVCETMRDWGERKTLIYTASASFLSTERMCSSSQAANYTHAIRRVSRGDRENAALSLSFFFGWVNVTSFLAVQVTSSISGFFFSRAYNNTFENSIPHAWLLISIPLMTSLLFHHKWFHINNEKYHIYSFSL